MTKVAVIGAGINSVTCAFRIKEKFPNFEVLLISDEFSPHTTGDGSGGLWYPYLCSNTPPSLLTTGRTFTSFVVQPAVIISHLSRLFTDLGGRVLRHKITSLQDPVLHDCQVVINCAGLGARWIVPDERVFPIRGQIFKVVAPWINATIIDESTCNYIIPNADTCVLGGTHQEHNYNTGIDDKDADFILNGCYQMIPSLQGAEIVKRWTGLRPGRDEVRIEPEQRNGKLYIHNYGHGGSGLTLFWGCGSEVLNILEQNLNNVSLKKSKL